MKTTHRQNILAAALGCALALTASFIAPAQSAELADQQTVTALMFTCWAALVTRAGAARTKMKSRFQQERTERTDKSNALRCLRLVLF